MESSKVKEGGPPTPLLLNAPGLAARNPAADAPRRQPQGALDSFDVDRSTGPDLPDGPGFWLAMAGVSAALGVGGITVAITEYHPPWTSAWFIAGAAMSTLGCAFAFWSLVLYLARKQAAGHWCPDPQAHVSQATQATIRADQVTAEKPQAALDGAQEKPIPMGGAVTSGLEVVIDDEKLTPFPGVALIMEIEYHVTNYDPVAHMLRLKVEGSTFYFAPPGSGDPPEHAEVRYVYGTISERRRWEQLPPRVRADETVRAVHVMRFAWDPTGRLPDYTLIISDGRREYTARPHGAVQNVQKLGPA